MLRQAVLVAAVMVLACVPSESKYQTRTLSGFVTDKRGNTLPGAAVQLENTITLNVRTYITGKNGRYRFNDLDADIEYTLKARYRNYWSAQKTLSKFDESRHPELDLVIPID